MLVRGGVGVVGWEFVVDLRFSVLGDVVIVIVMWFCWRLGVRVGYSLLSF